MKTHLTRGLIALSLSLSLLTGCVSFDRLDSALPEIDAEEITVVVKLTAVSTGRIHAKGLVNTPEAKSADEYNASLDTPWGSVSYEAKGYRRKKAEPNQGN